MPHVGVKQLRFLLSSVRKVRGDFAEIGVFAGETFRKLCREGISRQRLCHAFDSFEGMNDPTPGDGEHGAKQYPKGRLAVSMDRFVRLQGDIPRAAYRLHPGYIPECFAGAEHLRLSFALIDVDHYQPTLQALAWVWPRLNPGGVLLLDDYFPGKQFLASRAIDEFLLYAPPDLIEDGIVNDQLIVRKRP